MVSPPTGRANEGGDRGDRRGLVGGRGEAVAEGRGKVGEWEVVPELCSSQVTGRTVAMRCGTPGGWRGGRGDVGSVRRAGGESEPETGTPVTRGM